MEHLMKIKLQPQDDSTDWGKSDLLDREDFIDAIIDTDIFLAPHHGRESGVCEELFDIISPRLTIISDESYVTTSASSYYSSKSIG